MVSEYELKTVRTIELILVRIVLLIHYIFVDINHISVDLFRSRTYGTVTVSASLTYAGLMGMNQYLSC